jgi:hypothetical protein
MDVLAAILGRAGGTPDRSFLKTSESNAAILGMAELAKDSALCREFKILVFNEPEFFQANRHGAYGNPKLCGQRLKVIGMVMRRSSYQLR